MAQLLARAKLTIIPTPQRIIWLYKRWQPLYDYIHENVYPKVEFLRGVPINLEKDEFLDPGINNVIILDDMASETSKDKRVTDLFTEGSHHRNLSVISLNQNLYISKDPTQRRNCQYLVLFNNPIDKQPIMTLARQMYPTNPHELTRHFEDAVSKPYGYLLVDLKSETPEHLRMRANALTVQNVIREPEVRNPQLPGMLTNNGLNPVTSGEGISNPQSTTKTEHIRNPISENVIRRPLETANKSTQTDDYSNLTDSKCQVGLGSFAKSQNIINNMQTSDTNLDDDMQSCDECGAVYATYPDLNRHVEQMHGSKRKLVQNGGSNKKQKLMTQQQKDFWRYLIISDVCHEHDDEINKNANEYRPEHSSKVARNMSVNDMLPELRKSARKHYTDLVIGIYKLKDDPIFERVMEAADEYMDRFDPDVAIREAIRLYKASIGAMLVPAKSGNDLKDDVQSDVDDQSEEEQETKTDADLHENY